MPIFLSPTAMQRLYDPEGDRASARAAEKLGTMYGMSTMATSSIEEIANVSSGPKPVSYTHLTLPTILRV